MDKNWKSIAELVGISAIVASLIFVGFQLRQDRSIAQAAVFSESENSVNGLVEILTSNREIWVNGLKGEPLTEVEQAAFDNMVWALHTRRFGQYQRNLRLGVFPAHYAIEFYAFDIYQYPGLRRSFERRIATVSKRSSVFDRPDAGGFQTLLLEKLAELDASKPDKPDPTYVPF